MSTLLFVSLSKFVHFDCSVVDNRDPLKNQKVLPPHLLNVDAARSPNALSDITNVAGTMANSVYI